MPIKYFTIDKKLNDQYRIISPVLKGGMSYTLSAEKQDQKKVFIKILNFSDLEDWKCFDYFENEIKILKSLDHPNIPKYIDSFKIEDGEKFFYCLVQEYIDARNLKDMIGDKMRFNSEELKTIFMEILKVLKYIHELHPALIHRDINPKNILYDMKNKRPYLVDFGVGSQMMASTLLAGNTIVGTMGYIAPEQLYGKATPSSDLFSLGISFINILTHRAPHELQDNNMQINFKSYLKGKDVFYDIIEKMVEPMPNMRYQDCDEVLDDLQNLEDKRRFEKEIKRNQRLLDETGSSEDEQSNDSRKEEKYKNYFDIKDDREKKKAKQETLRRTEWDGISHKLEMLEEKAEIIAEKKKNKKHLEELEKFSALKFKDMFNVVGKNLSIKKEDNTPDTESGIGLIFFYIVMLAIVVIVIVLES